MNFVDEKHGSDQVEGERRRYIRKLVTFIELQLDHERHVDVDMNFPIRGN